MYSIKLDDNSYKNVGKGIKKNILKDVLDFEQYKNALFNEVSLKNNMYMLRSIKHNIYSIKQNKTSLNPYDDKRYICDDGITTLPYGHHSITENKYIEDEKNKEDRAILIKKHENKNKYQSKKKNL